MLRPLQPPVPLPAARRAEKIKNEAGKLVPDRFLFFKEALY